MYPIVIQAVSRLAWFAAGGIAGIFLGKRIKNDDSNSVEQNTKSLFEKIGGAVPIRVSVRHNKREISKLSNEELGFSEGDDENDPGYIGQAEISEYDITQEESPTDSNSDSK